MKKIISMGGLILVSIFMLSGCQSEKMYTFNFYDYMDTYIRVQMMASSESDANQYHDDIDAILACIMIYQHHMNLLMKIQNT